MKLPSAVKIWPGILAVLLLGLACSTSATPGVVPTMVSVPTNTVPTATVPATTAPTPTVAVTPTIPPGRDSATVPPSWTAPLRPGVPAITVGEAVFTVELADTPEKRSRGLSGRPGLDAGSGMLFVFDSESRVAFWMPEMQFPLDFVWIASDCLVADITQDVPPPPPDMDLSELPRYRPSVPVQYVLEINAGEIAAAGITRGDPVGFDGSISGWYGC